MEACDKGYFDIVCCLVKNGARINAVNEVRLSAVGNNYLLIYINLTAFCLLLIEWRECIV